MTGDELYAALPERTRKHLRDLVAELVKTLGHERTHVWQVKTHGYPTEAERQVYEDAAKATEAQWGTTTR